MDDLARLREARWTRDAALAWEAERPRIVGCNYLPRSAVNSVEMWQAETFDPLTIAQELGWAAGLGMNSVRVFLPHLVWSADAAGLKERLTRFLDMAASCGLSTMPVLFDDCAFSGKEARLGPQDDPVPGVHNSGWVPSPGPRAVVDRAAWPALEAYVADLMSAFGRDPRVVVWDLYNEPGNSGMGERSLPLLAQSFVWARRAAPAQPLTAGIWRPLKTNLPATMTELMLGASDVASFHGYDAPEVTAAWIAKAGAEGRPLICTEWLHRPFGNTYTSILPLFEAHRVHWYQWGLVRGRTQTHMPWGSEAGAAEPALWQHDALHADGLPWDASELALLAGHVAHVAKVGAR